MQQTGNNLTDLTDVRNTTERVMRSTVGTKFLVIQNVDDSVILQHHIEPLCRTFCFDTIKYGLTLKDNMLLWIYRATGGHTSLDSKHIAPFITGLALEYLDNPEFAVSSSLDSFYIAISEIWAKIYDDQAKIDALLKK